MEDVSVELVVNIPQSCTGPNCKKQRVYMDILMWDTMVPAIGDWVDVTYEMKVTRLAVVNRLWNNRQLTLICRPVRPFSIESLKAVGFKEDRT